MSSLANNTIKMLQEIKTVMNFYLSNDAIDDYAMPIVLYSKLCETLLDELYKQNVAKDMDPQKADLERYYGTKISYFALRRKDAIGAKYLSKEAIGLLNTIRVYRNSSVHGVYMSKQDLYEYSKAMTSFLSWLLIKYPNLVSEGSTSEEYRKIVSSLLNDVSISMLNENKVDDTSTIRGYIHTFDATGSPKAENAKLSESVTNILESVIGDAVKKIIDNSNKNTDKVLNEVKNLSIAVEKLSLQINSYQELLQEQLELAQSDAEIDRIMEAYSNTCVERIKREISASYNEKLYESYQLNLKESFGEAWNKLSDESKDFLVSSKLIYSYLINMPAALDYSGVCLLVTKALEFEMSKRFYYGYIDFLEQEYDNVGKPKKLKDYSQYPPCLINKEYKKPIRAKDFTLGSVPYVFCAKVSDRNTTEENELNLKNLVKYALNRLFDNMSEQEAINTLVVYGEKVDDITKNYRNKAAHTNQLKRVDAEECFNIVLDVERFLKKVLDSFKV